MKGSRRSRVPVALAVFLLAAGSASPLFADITLTASTGTVVMYGLARELVYGLYNGQRYTLSELDWPLEPLVSVRESLALSTSVGFTCSLDVLLGVPAKTGSGSDSDWLNYEVNGDPSRTNYYQFDCSTERAIQLDAQAGWDFPLAPWVTLEPFLAFGLADYKWSARDGFLQYPPNWFIAPGPGPGPYPPSSTEPQQPVSGTLIIYQQTYLVLAVGLAAKIRLGQRLSCALSFTFSPLVFCNDLDNHVLSSPGSDFYDSLRYGMLLEPGLSLDWKLSARARVSASVSYRHIAGLVGDTSIVTTGVGNTPAAVSSSEPGGAGASFDALDASLGIALSL